MIIPTKRLIGGGKRIFYFQRSPMTERGTFAPTRIWATLRDVQLLNRLQSTINCHGNCPRHTSTRLRASPDVRAQFGVVRWTVEHFELRCRWVIRGDQIDEDLRLAAVLLDRRLNHQSQFSPGAGAAISPRAATTSISWMSRTSTVPAGTHKVGYTTNPTDGSQSRGMTGIGVAVKKRRFPVGARPTRRFAPAESPMGDHGGNEMAEAFE